MAKDRWDRRRFGSASLKARRRLEKEGVNCSPMTRTSQGLECDGWPVSLLKPENTERVNVTSFVNEYGRLFR